MDVTRSLADRSAKMPASSDSQFSLFRGMALIDVILSFAIRRGRRCTRAWPHRPPPSNRHRYDIAPVGAYGQWQPICRRHERKHVIIMADVDAGLLPIAS